jgi:hypothetical protein
MLEDNVRSPDLTPTLDREDRTAGGGGIGAA